MSYANYFIIGIMATGAAWMLVSQLFAAEVSRGMEATFDFVEYRLALRARARMRTRLAGREAHVAHVAPRAVEHVFASQQKGSTQQLSIARIAA